MRESMLCVKSRLRAQGKRVVSRQTVEGQEQATCVLMASMLCAKSSSRVEFKRVVCQEPVEGWERATCVHKAILESRVSYLCADSRE